MMKKFLPFQMAAFILTFELFANQTTQATPDTPEQKKPDSHFFMSADFLYWQANQTGMAYATVVNYFAHIPAPPLDDQVYYSNDLNVDFRFDPGVRVSVGFQPKQDFWRTDFIWTHHNTKASGASNNPNAIEGPVILSFFLPIPTSVSNDSINGQAFWRVNYNTIDLDIHKELLPSKTVGFQAHLGLKNLWLNQKYNYYGFNAWKAVTTDDPDVSSILFIDTQANMVQNIWGLGPMIGISSEWNIYQGFNLFGEASFALLWAYVHSSEIGKVLTEKPVTTLNKLATFHTTLPHINLIVGGQYDVDIYNKYHFSVRAGWELQTLFDTNFLGASYQSYGNFNLSGLTVGFAFDF